jgi:hypothetical protein
MIMTKVLSWVRNLTEEVVGSAPFVIGDIVQHPSGRVVKIVDGQYWGHRGLSNFWYWQEILSEGVLGAKECGYGWQPKTIENIAI